MGVKATGVRIPPLPPLSAETQINSLTMRFIQFLVEAPQQKPPQQGDWIRKAAKADRQRARRATAQRGDRNKQAMQANVQQPPGAVAAAGQPPPAQRTNDLIQPPPGNFQKPEKPKPAAPQADTSLDPFLAAAKGNRAKALEMITLLGAIYQTKKRNPQVQMSVPKIVTDSEDKDTMQKLFDVVKGKTLPELTAAYQEIKRAAAMPGQAPPAGTQTAPQTPGQTPAGKSMLQNLMNRIKQAAKSLSPQDLSVLRKEVDKAAQNAKPNPSPNAQQPIGKPVVTQG